MVVEVGRYSLERLGVEWNVVELKEGCLIST